jgi:hypothetical protein
MRAGKAKNGFFAMLRMTAVEGRMTDGKGRMTAERQRMDSSLRSE